MEITAKQGCRVSAGMQNAGRRSSFGNRQTPLKHQRGALMQSGKKNYLDRDGNSTPKFQFLFH